MTEKQIRNIIGCESDEVIEEPTNFFANIRDEIENKTPEEVAQEEQQEAAENAEIAALMPQLVGGEKQ